MRSGSTPGPSVGPGCRVFLDGLRMVCALVVAAGHLSQKQITLGWPDLTPYAVNAVTLFFLLSGFVIRVVTRERRGGLKGYLVDRGSRVYSVLVPAVAVAMLVDLAIGASAGESAVSALKHGAGAAAANLSFTAFCWHQQVTFWCDSPMWSLCFEGFYYLIFGTAFYLRGWARVVAVCAVCALAGPEVLVLLPVWLAGCGLYECWVRWQRSRRALWVVSAVLVVGVAAMDGLRGAAMRWSHRWVLPSGVWMPHVGHGSPVSLNAYAWGAVFWAGMLWGLLVSDVLGGLGERSTARVQRLAAGTFPLYLLHLPVFRLVVLLAGGPLHSVAGELLLLVATVAGSVVVGAWLERWKRGLRQWAGGATARRPSSVSPALAGTAASTA